MNYNSIRLVNSRKFKIIENQRNETRWFWKREHNCDEDESEHYKLNSFSKSSKIVQIECEIPLCPTYKGSKSSYLRFKKAFKTSKRV